jgi:hypothetical protein
MGMKHASGACYVRASKIVRRVMGKSEQGKLCPLMEGSQYTPGASFIHSNIRATFNSTIPISLLRGIADYKAGAAAMHAERERLLLHLA